MAKEKSLKTFLTGILRRASLKWPARTEALRFARVDRGLYKCAMCTNIFKKQDISVDHKEPVVPMQGVVAEDWSWDDFIHRLFVDTEGLQVLCTTCHNAKSAVEDSMRAVYTAKRKAKKKLDSE